MFGLQIRKIGVTAIFEDVDRILKKPYDIEKETTIHALQKMLKPDKWFCTSTVERCAKLCFIVIPEANKQIYDCIHCIHWSAMEPKYREKITALILNDFRSVLTR